MQTAYFCCLVWAALVCTITAINSGIGYFYAAKLVFDELRPEGISGPLADQAAEVAQSHPEIMVARRLYAIETWLINGVAAASSALAPLLWWLVLNTPMS